MSIDVIGDDRSSIVDGTLTMVNATTAKIISWYDNEWAYACRMLDVARLVGARVTASAGSS